MNNKISHSILKLRFDRPLDIKVKVKDLRGAVANLYPEKQLLHQHREDGKLDYCYPLVQYKIINGECLLAGFRQGAELLANLDLAAKTLLLGRQSYTIITKELEFHYISLGITDTLQQYRFITPWLALNQKNYQEWQTFSKVEKHERLRRTLIGNILSMAKGLEYVVTEEIKAEVDVRPVPATLKGVPMIGFLGKFQVNFRIPDYLGLGKSVSRGFGTVVQSTEDRIQSTDYD